MVWQQEHRLLYEDFLERYRIILLVFLGLFGFLSLRLFHLQIIQGNYYRAVSEKQRTQIITERAPRGVIYDCKGAVIVGNRTAFVALFYPFSQDTIPGIDILNRLKGILESKDLSTIVTQGWRSGQVMRLSNNLTREEMFRLQEQRLVLPGISVISESRRECNDPEANSHLVGYLSEVTKRELESLHTEGYKSGDWTGRGGLEQEFNEPLRGQDGGWEIEVDAAGRQTRLVRHIPSKIGNSLHTTIDADLQRVAGEELKKSPTGRGAVVALDPRTGAVRALVSSPGYNPNESLTREFSKYILDKRLPLFNRTIQGLYAPGSTFKIITFAGALAVTKIDPSLTFTCTGKFAYGNKTFACWYKKGHGALSLIPALANSCNVYFYQLGLRVGAQVLENTARAFHLGEPTGIELPNEKKGLVPSPEWKLKKMHETWQQGDTINIAIGQGPLWVTPAQMAVVISAVANRGVSYQPYIVDQITSPEGETLFKAKQKRKNDVVLPEPVWKQLHKGLEEAVVNGTGRGCYFPKMRVAGKTGTAQNPHGQDHAWFVSFAPAEDPQLAIAIIVENGGHGGTAAVPIARRMYETAFKLTPQEPPAAPSAVEEVDRTMDIDVPVEDQ